MSEGEDRWTVRLSAAAQKDFAGIIRWTARRFGEHQAIAYTETLTSALEALASGPSVAGTKARPEIGPDLLTLHVSRGGRKGRHFILFRRTPDKDARAIEVIRLLHDAMDLARYGPDEEDQLTIDRHPH